MTTTRNRVEVMHGANLDMLGRRDPEHYGDFTLAELEGQIDGWAREAGLNAALLPDEPRGRVHRAPPPRARDGATR